MTFSAEQKVQELDIQCQVSGIRSFNYTHLGKLVISKFTAGEPEILASVSVYDGQIGPRSSLANAQVTGQVSYDATSKRYLRILWTDLSDDLNGNYTCQAYGVNNDLISSHQVTVSLKSMGIHFTATPEIIRIGVTKRLDISCSVPEPELLNVSTAGSLEIFRIEDGLECLFARIRYTSGAISPTGLEGLLLNGSLDHHNSHLTVTWTNPTPGQTGEYICHFTGVGVKADPVFFSKRLNVTWEIPDQDVLIQQLIQQTRRHEELIEFQQENEQQLQEAVETLEDTENGNAECRNPTSCDDIYFSMEPGQHVVRVEPEDGLGPITVLCDVKGKREIYTVFQKRFNGSVDFFRNFRDYENGFGSLESEFWLGLKNIRRLLLQTGNKNQLRVDMSVKETNINYTRIYPTFSIGPGDEYRLTVGGLYDRGYGMSSSSYKPFSTYDHGLTQVAGRNSRRAGWWFPEDHGYVNLNGVWGVAGKPYSVFWWELSPDLNSILEKTEMKFKRNN